MEPKKNKIQLIQIDRTSAWILLISILAFLSVTGLTVTSVRQTEYHHSRQSTAKSVPLRSGLYKREPCQQIPTR